MMQANVLNGLKTAGLLTANTVGVGAGLVLTTGGTAVAIYHIRIRMTGGKPRHDIDKLCREFLRILFGEGSLAIANSILGGTAIAVTGYQLTKFCGPRLLSTLRDIPPLEAGYGLLIGSSFAVGTAIMSKDLSTNTVTRTAFLEVIRPFAQLIPFALGSLAGSYLTGPKLGYAGLAIGTFISAVALELLPRSRWGTIRSRYFSYLLLMGGYALAARSFRSQLKNLTTHAHSLSNRWYLATPLALGLQWGALKMSDKERSFFNSIAGAFLLFAGTAISIQAWKGTPMRALIAKQLTLTAIGALSTWRDK